MASGTAVSEEFGTVRIDANGPFDHEAVAAMLAAHAIPGVEELDGYRYRRIVAIDGVPVVVTIVISPTGVMAEWDVAPSDPGRLEDLIRCWFDLDTDIARIDMTLAADPLLAPLIDRHPGLRLIGYPDEFEGVAMTVIGQQVSLAGARTFAARLVAAFGEVHEQMHRFPTAARLANLDVDEIRGRVGLTGSRARTLHEVARRWKDGPILVGMSPAQARRLLLDIPGIGPWTADCLLVRVLQDPDTFASGDLVARRALGLDERAAAERSTVWAPFRSYALVHLWTDAAYLSDGVGAGTPSGRIDR